MSEESCYCEDFESSGTAEPDVCLCGHVLDEHEGGFFNRCTYNTDTDD